MIWILFALIAALPWALAFILEWHWWIPLSCSGGVAVIALGWFFFKRFRASRSAGGLENAIAAQGQQQVMNARPERRAEIQALQKQIQDGIGALKSSKLGGRKRGSSALYSLPWYAIIGPPGAGKTTALKHSGLVFPYADSSVRGVGGTRNCDWWFTNEAILLDTAGRYTTEHEDQSEWFAFLDMLRKYRSDKPLNGLLVAVSVTDIIDANEAQLDEMGTKLRARIDEVMTRLGMVLPVYFVITKCDLIAGFSQFFGDLRKSDRSQVWGCTLPLNAPKLDPSAIVASEFDNLVTEIHKRAIKRMGRERDRQAREAIFHFPLELAGVKRNLAQLIARVFVANTFQGTPTFRGFYLTSGTQEGTPLSRVLQRMGSAMGVQGPQMAAQAKVESKSYFLHDVFMKVVFPDASVAARSASEMRRQRLVRVSVSVVACTLAVLLAFPSGCSYARNRTLIDTTEEHAKTAASIKWDDNQAISGKLTKLDPLLETLTELQKHDEEGPPVGMQFLMYSGDELYRPAIRVYVANMQLGFVQPCKYALEGQLKGIKGDRYYVERLKLKTYLMLSSVEHIDVEWATGRFTALWAELQKDTSDVPIYKLKEQMRPHVRFYFELLKARGDEKPRAAPVPANPKIVKGAREVLMAVPAPRRYYSLFVDSVQHVLGDPTGDDVVENQVFPPITLKDLFTDRPDVLDHITSRQFKKKKTWYQVEGPYTYWGRHDVLANFKEARKLLEDEQWVVPLAKDERGANVGKHLKRLADEYETRYINAWKGFLLDLQVRSPATLKEAADLYETLDEIPLPYLRLLRAVSDHTQWTKQLPGGDVAKDAVDRQLNRAATRRTRGLRLGIEIGKIEGKTSRVPSAFRKTVGFAVHEKGKRNLKTALSQYTARLDTLRRAMVKLTRDQPDAPVNIMARDLQKAVTETEALMQPLDSLAQQTLLPLLQHPLNVGGRIRLSPSVTAPANP